MSPEAQQQYVACHPAFITVVAAASLDDGPAMLPFQLITLSSAGGRLG